MAGIRAHALHAPNPQATMTGWTRTLRWLGLRLLALIVIGATVQGVMTATARRRHPRPGRLVDAGGHQLHLYCTGEGAPTILLEASAMSMSAEWGWVQSDLARTTRTCSYDRAGLGFSEAGDGPFDPTLVPQELRTALSKVGIAPPYVVVGHGLGGAFAQLFTAAYPADVVATVIIDAPTPGALAEMRPEARDRFRGFVRLMQAMPWLARIGVLHVRNPLTSLASGLPIDRTDEAGILEMFLTTPDHLARGAAELRAFERTLDALGRVTSLGAHPVVVVSPGTPAADETAADVAEAAARQARRAALSPRGERQAIAGATSIDIITGRGHAARVAAIIRDLIRDGRP